MSRSLESLYSGSETPSGLLMDCDYLLVIKTMDRQIETWFSQVSEGNLNGELPCAPRSTASESSDAITPGFNDASAQYSRLMSIFYANYAMLVINSFGLQDALERTPVNIPHFFARVHTSAKTCALLMRDELGPQGFLKYSPDSHFVFGSYAVLSLLKVSARDMGHMTASMSRSRAHVLPSLRSQLIRPEFLASHDTEQETLGLVKDVADTFDSVSVGSMHTPSLYSVFLRALLSAKAEPPAAAEHGGNVADVHLQGGGGQGASGFGGGGGDGSLTNGINTPHVAQHEPSFMLSEFQFASEMGPVADLSTFPPTMAASRPGEDNMGMLSIDNILSGGFWDNVLVPGECRARCAVLVLVLALVLMVILVVAGRVFEPHGGPQRGLRVRRGRQRVHHAAFWRDACGVGAE